MPHGLEYQRFHKIATGDDDAVVSLAKLGDMGIGEDLLELAHDFFRIEKSSQGVFEPYVTVHPPETGEVDGAVVHYVRKTLNDQGKLVYAALAIGWIWDVKANDVALEATLNHYGEMLEQGSISRKNAEVIANNKDERLKELLNKLVYFKLRAKEDRNGNFVEIKDAA